MDSATASAPARRSRRSLGQRFALAFALLCSIVALVQGVFAYYAVEGAEDSMSDALVQREMQLFRERFEAGDAQAAPSSTRLHGYVVRTVEDAARIPAFARGLSGGPHELYAEGRTYHVVSAPSGDASLVLIFDTTVYEEHVLAFRRVMIASVVVASALALLIGALLSRRLVRPLTQVTATLQKLAPGATRQRGGDEAARLLEAFERYQRQVERLVAQEKAFTANVSHELRTPLTALRTSAELMQMDERLPPTVHARVDDMVRVVDGMSETINASLQLARDHPATVEPLALREVVEDVLLPLRAALLREAVEVVVDVPATLIVHADRQALQMVLRNLLSNAITHTDAGEVRVRAGPGWIEVKDTGHGIAQQHLPYVFDRHFSAARVDEGRASAGPTGYGIGLAIVRQLCDRLGWSISLSSETCEGPLRGTTARLELAR
jgi:signal transduction histidine kinase